MLFPFNSFQFPVWCDQVPGVTKCLVQQSAWCDQVLGATNMFKLECLLNVLITLHSVGGIVCQFYSEVRMRVDINVFYESWLTVLKYGTKISCRDCSGSLVNSKLVLVKGFIMGASMMEKKLI